MGIAKHGRCRRGVRPALGSIGRPGAGTREVRPRFWLAVADGLTSEKAAEVAGVSSAVGARLFRQGGGMPNVSLAPPTDRFSALQSGRRLHCFARREKAFARSLASLIATHRRSRANCVATQRRAAATSSTAPSLRIGMHSAGPDVRGRASWWPIRA